MRLISLLLVLVIVPTFREFLGSADQGTAEGGHDKRGNASKFFSNSQDSNLAPSTYGNSQTTNAQSTYGNAQSTYGNAQSTNGNAQTINAESTSGNVEGTNGSAQNPVATKTCVYADNVCTKSENCFIGCKATSDASASQYVVKNKQLIYQTFSDGACSSTRLTKQLLITDNFSEKECYQHGTVFVKSGSLQRGISLFCLLFLCLLYGVLY